MEPMLSGHALWSYQSEVTARTLLANRRAGSPGVLPFHSHEGTAILQENALALTDHDHLYIPLQDIIHVFIGFDEIFQQSFATKLGLAWQPLRIRFRQMDKTEAVYLMIDSTLVGTNNQQWFQALKEILSS